MFKKNTKEFKNRGEALRYLAVNYSSWIKIHFRETPILIQYEIAESDWRRKRIELQQENKLDMFEIMKPEKDLKAINLREYKRKKKFVDALTALWDDNSDQARANATQAYFWLIASDQLKISE